MSIAQQANAARQAAHFLAFASDSTRARALFTAAEHIENQARTILSENAMDVQAAKEAGLMAPLISRLALSEEKITEMCAGLRSVASLPDPLGKTLLATELVEGLTLYRVSCPIGVIGAIFESRPDALTQIAALCVKSGNAVLLKGGREASRSCRALFAAMDRAARESGLPIGWAALLESREEVAEMLKQDDQIDLIIPRGSNEFVQYIKDNSRIPVLGHAAGICHVYVDRAADVGMAVLIAVDAKTQYVAVCNAVETLLVHRDIADAALPALAEALRAKGVLLRGCDRTRAIIDCEPATQADWDTEYLDLVLSIRVVDSTIDAIDHINRHGSGHTDAIVTDDESAANLFCARVDSASVFWNCSTRFSDGYRYGFGAEVGIATGKTHARGPMGIDGLCTYKYKLLGSGQTISAGVQYTFRSLNDKCPLEDSARC